MKKKQELHFYPSLPIVNRRKVKELLLKATESRKKQRDLLMNNIIKPLTKQINLSQEVLRGEIAIEHYLKRNERLRKQIGGFFKNVEI